MFESVFRLLRRCFDSLFEDFRDIPKYEHENVPKVTFKPAAPIESVPEHHIKYESDSDGSFFYGRKSSYLEVVDIVTKFLNYT